MTSVTVTMDQLVGLLTGGYVVLHLLFGMVTHYHSAYQVRKYNADLGPYDGNHRIGPFKILFLFIGRMTFGFPWFVVSRFIAPIGNRWHWTPKQIQEWGN